MKIVIISDTHSMHGQLKIPKGDMLIHCGDATMEGHLGETLDFAEWFGNLGHKHKIFVPGNHDFYFEMAKGSDLLDLQVKFGFRVLIDEAEVMGDLKIYGTPYTPIFFNWAFMESEDDLAMRFKRIPNETDILVTHGPPFSILDEVTEHLDETNHVGSRALLARVSEIAPKLNCFGHIHTGYGEKELSLKDGRVTKFVNAACTNEFYDVVNKPVIVEI